EYIPARFGFSSAAEMFVFCSGCASAIAFGSVFARCGWGIGTIRIACRIWQLYWAHIGLFLVLATISITAVPDGIIATTRLAVLRYAHFLCLLHHSAAATHRAHQTPVAVRLAVLANRRVA